MPECPVCQTPYEEGRRYCSQCSSYLLNPEEGNRLCPQCHIRVAARQEICHNCNAVLSQTDQGKPLGQARGAAAPPGGPAPYTWPPPLAPRSGLPGWGWGLLAGAGVVIVVLVVVLITLIGKKGPSPQEPAATTPPAATGKTAPAPDQPKAEKPAAVPGPVAAPTPAPAPEIPAGPSVPVAPTLPSTPAPGAAAGLEDQIKETLEQLKEAQLQQDIVRFMSCYSYVFPALDRKRQETLATWKKFAFVGMDYKLDKVKEQEPGKARARVTWTVQVQGRKDREPRQLTQTYEVGLAKELGKWRISSLKQVKPDEDEDEDEEE